MKLTITFLSPGEPPETLPNALGVASWRVRVDPQDTDWKALTNAEAVSLLGALKNRGLITDATVTALRDAANSTAAAARARAAVLRARADELDADAAAYEQANA